MTRMKMISLSALIAAVVGIGPACAQQAGAKITEARARAIAAARVPGGTVKASELENEKGRLIYSFEFVVAGKSGVQEVNVDARTGKVVSVEHEKN